MTREARLEAALQEIADPIGTLRKRAEAQGTRLNGLMIPHIVTPHYLSQIARDALAIKDAAPPASRSPFTWEARADVQPIVHLGTKEDCEAWMRTVGGKDVFVMGDHGKAVLVGIVMHTSARSLP